MALCLGIQDAPAHLAACSGRVHFLGTREFRRIGNTRAHVLDGKFGVKVLDNLLEGHALLDELEHAIHRNTGPANTSLTEVYSRVDDDAVEHDGSVGPLSVGRKKVGNHELRERFVEVLADLRSPLQALISSAQQLLPPPHMLGFGNETPRHVAAR